MLAATRRTWRSPREHGKCPSSNASHAARQSIAAIDSPWEAMAGLDIAQKIVADQP